MKKILSLALAFIFVFALAVPAFALELKETDIAPKAEGDNFVGTNNGGGDETVVTYDVKGSYTITIPAALTINYTKDNNVDTGSDSTLAAADVMLPYMAKLEVTIAGSGTDGAFTVCANGDKNIDEIPFTVKVGETTIVSGTTPVLAMQTEGTRTDRGLWSHAAVTLDLTANELPKYNETYTGYITFTVDVIDIDTP